MSKHGPYLTKNRRLAFAKCQHRGFGAFCHRCQQANRFEEMAKELGEFGKHYSPTNTTQTIPAYLILNEKMLHVRHEHFSVSHQLTHKSNIKKLLDDTAKSLVAEATRLRINPSLQ